MAQNGNEMEWKDLLCQKTLSDRSTPAGFDFLNNYEQGPFETDYGEIVSSAAFRRLQDKTQVFPLDQSDFVRTRLTHSMETSAIAHQLGVMVTNGKVGGPDNKFENASEEVKRSIPTVLSCAGLIHDLGNPPFGHFGEEVIRDWFESDKELYPYRDRQKGVHLSQLFEREEKLYEDLSNFEGNAQAIRILSKTECKPTGNDLNLTYAVINTLMKYTADSHSLNKEDQDIKNHKLGYYLAEADMIDRICSATTTKREAGYCRHPLAFLLEAADDIAYATSDLEDTVEKGLLTVDQFVEYYDSAEEKNDYDLTLLENLKSELKKSKNSEEKITAFRKWTSLVRQCLMYSVAYVFYDNYEKIMEGSYKEDLFQEGVNKHTLKILKGAVHKYAHKFSGILELELSAKKIISSLLDDFVCAVIVWPESKNEHEEKPTKENEKLQLILPDSLKADYDYYVNNSAGEPTDEEKLYRRILIATDYISGMTDSYALNLYQKLNGTQ